MRQTIFFGAGSTDSLSGLLLIAEGKCAHVTVYGVDIAEMVTIERVLRDAAGNELTSSVLDVELDDSAPNYVLSSPGAYRFRLTAGAVGFATVEVVELDSYDACSVAIHAMRR